MATKKFSKQKTREEIISEAKVLGISPGEAEMIADKVEIALAEWMKKRSMVTEEDLSGRIAEEIKKYNKDLAYIFTSRERII